jgi:hypothetical protein
MAKKQPFDLQDYIKKQQSATPPVAFKPPNYVIMPPEVQAAMCMPGFPLGHMSMLFGLSDSGKTGLLLHAVKKAQEQGILPVLIITENKLTRDRIIQAGIDLDKIVLVEDLKFLEAVYDYISMKIQEVLDGALPMDVMVFWDSAAGCPSKDSYSITAAGKIEKEFDNRKNANVIGFYNNIIASRIADTRKEGVVGSLGIVFVTQAYIGEKPKFPPGLPAPIIPNGGEKVWFPLSLGLEIKEGKKLDTTYKGQRVNFGLVSKITVRKNHINELSSSGDIVLAGSQILPNDKDAIEAFKETRKEEWSSILETALEGVKEDE